MSYKILFYSGATSLFAQEAFISVPVADLLLTAKPPCFTKTVTEFYNTLPLQPTDTLLSPSCCPRIFQGLMHERVLIQKTTREEAQITLTNACYLTKQNQIKPCVCWIKKRNLTLCDPTLQQFLPPPVDMKSAHTTTNTVVLIKPFFDTTTQQLLSAGTRLRLEKKHRQTYRCFCYDNERKKFLSITIPQKVGQLSSPTKSPQSKRTRFCALLQQWAKQTKGKSIPYVWGGGSYTMQVKIDSIVTKAKQFCQHKQTYFAIRHYHQKIKTGFDCSSLVLRAAQICDIPYYARNTTTIAGNCIPVSDKEPLENGDLILMQGHVLALVDKKLSLCVEAAGYKYGYGKIQLLPLSKIFSNITTTQELLDHYNKKIPGHRIDSEGKLIGKYQIKLRKLC